MPEALTAQALNIHFLYFKHLCHPFLYNTPGRFSTTETGLKVEEKSKGKDGEKVSHKREKSFLMLLLAITRNG